MTTAIATKDALTAERIDRGLEWLKHSLPSLREDHEARKQAAQAVACLSEPAHPAKLMARVLALLSPYYDKDTPQAVREIEAEDWAEALGEFPYWAVERACRWWKSDQNGNRRKRPFEGDIAARCKFEMSAIRAAQVHLAEDPREAKHEDRQELTEQERADMRARLAEVGAKAVKAMRAKAEASGL